MDKVGDHIAKHIPLSLLCCKKPGGFLRPWKVTASSLVSKLLLSLAFGSWISLVYIASRETTTHTSILLSYAHHDASKQIAKILAIHALSLSLPFLSSPLFPSPSFPTPASSLGQNCQLSVSLPIQPLLNVCEIWIKVLHS